MIADFQVTEQMLRHFIARAAGARSRAHVLTTVARGAGQALEELEQLHPSRHDPRKPRNRERADHPQAAYLPILRRYPRLGARCSACVPGRTPPGLFDVDLSFDQIGDPSGGGDWRRGAAAPSASTVSGCVVAAYTQSATWSADLSLSCPNWVK